MSSSIVLGVKPLHLIVDLTQNADFTSTLKNVDGNWSPTAEIQLRFGYGDDTIMWAANISGDLAIFDIDDEQVNALLATRIRNAKLFYIDGDVEVAWGVGDVITND